MTRKVEPKNWPPLKGTYLLGSAYSPVAVLIVKNTVGKGPEEELMEKAIDWGASIAGTCRTANRGLEKVVLNTVTNPNIRWLIVTGLRDNAHKVGLAALMLWKFGVDNLHRVLCGDEPCSPKTIPEAALPNISTDIIERFRKQIMVVPALPVDVDEKDLVIVDVPVGSKVLTVPVLRQDWEQRKFTVVVTRKYLENVLEFLIHSCLQEEWEPIIVDKLLHLYNDVFPIENLRLYDPGAFPEPPPEVAHFSMESHSEEVLVGELLAGEIVKAGRLYVGYFQSLADGYRELTQLVSKVGWTRYSRHGPTREVSAVIIYEKVPKVELVEEGDSIRVLKIDIGVPLTEQQHAELIRYCEDFLNGRLGGFAYTYGRQLKKFGLDLAEHGLLDRTIAEKLMIDQVRALIDSISRDLEGRHHVAVLWNPMVDNRGLREQPCMCLIQIVPFRVGNNVELWAFVYMRSQDLKNAHVQNVCAVSALLHYLAEKVREKTGQNIQVGKIVWIAASLHIYDTEL